jgi:OmpA-OmpF porin, OOP family
MRRFLTRVSQVDCHPVLMAKFKQIAIGERRALAYQIGRKFKLCTRSVLAALLMLVAATAPAQIAKTYRDAHKGTVTFPLGDLSFADEVVSFQMGEPHADPLYSDPKDALGPPDYDEKTDTKYTTLGCGGVLTLRFTDDVLIDVKGPDLYVFEIGPDIEPTRLEISKDGEQWVDIGHISGGTAAVDIGPHVKSGDVFHYVRLTDLKKACGGQWPGADIDAVGAIGAGLRISFNSAVLFDFNKYDLKPEAQHELARVVGLVGQYKGGSVLVEGHTDAVGSADYNQTLSANRAKSVRDFLEVQTKGEGIHFNSRGYGKTRPIAGNETEDGRAKNRRVEIAIIPAGTAVAEPSLQ